MRLRRCQSQIVSTKDRGHRPCIPIERNRWIEGSSVKQPSWCWHRQPSWSSTPKPRRHLQCSQCYALNLGLLLRKLCLQRADLAHDPLRLQARRSAVMPLGNLASAARTSCRGASASWVNNVASVHCGRPVPVDRIEPSYASPQAHVDDPGNRSDVRSGSRNPWPSARAGEHLLW